MSLFDAILKMEQDRRRHQKEWEQTRSILASGCNLGDHIPEAKPLPYFAEPEDTLPVLFLLGLACPVHRPQYEQTRLGDYQETKYSKQIRQA